MSYFFTMPLNIPGYYFDPAKGKYFKIEPTHIAPKGSQYSQQAIKKAQQEAEVSD